MLKVLEDETIFKVRLNYLIEEKGVTQKELADYVGITRQSIGFYTRGERSPDINTLKKICEYFNVSADWMIGRINKRVTNITNNEIIEKLGLSDASIKVLEILRGKKDKDLLKLLNLIIEQEAAILNDEDNFFDEDGYFFLNYEPYSPVLSTIYKSIVAFEFYIKNPGEKLVIAKNGESMLVDSVDKKNDGIEFDIGEFIDKYINEEIIFSINDLIKEHYT